VALLISRLDPRPAMALVNPPPDRPPDRLPDRPPDGPREETSPT